MAADTYYSDPSLHGNYQYITLEDIINNYLMSRDEDSYEALVPRHKILYHARRGIREFFYDVVQEVRAIEQELSPSLTITLPPDYVNYVRISWVDSKGMLHPMAIDKRTSIAEEYLQDNEWGLLFDNEGCVLIGDGEDESELTPVGQDDPVYSQYEICQTGYQPNRDGSKVFMNGKYIIDKTAGLIKFGSEVEGKDIVLEYISDGLFTGCEGRPEDELRIHKFAETALIDYIHHELIKNRRNVPYNEKIRARKEYWNSRRMAKMRMSTMRIDELRQIMYGASKVIK